MKTPSFTPARILVLVTGLALGVLAFLSMQHDSFWSDLLPAVAPEARFQLAINGELQEPFLSDSRYPETDATIAGFLLANGFALTPECIGDTSGDIHCADSDNILQLYVDGEVAPKPFNHYRPDGTKQLLLYHGPEDSENLNQLLTNR